MKTILITGSAGFIGFRTTQLLLEKGYDVIGIDNMNNYYDVKLKEYRLKELTKYQNFKFFKVDIENLEALEILFKEYPFDGVINLAARAGVRYSIENPFIYITTNILGTTNLLELSKKYGIRKFVLASTSSLYAGQKMPFKENLPVNTPISPYAASKKGAEAVAYTYHYLYNIDISVLRYFTVYGPAGRPDMSIFRFIKWIDEEKPVVIYGDGTQERDFTYVDDIAKGTTKALETETGYEIINLGGNKPYKLKRVIELIEQYLGKKAKIIHKDFHKADMRATWADIEKAKKLLKWEPKIPLEEGIKKTVNWHIENRELIKEILV
ncbi:GDP-mannose 4,6-dehydratase [Desulfurobacterium atlanticum]|uniref:Nucleoside-diphosphate-sugar epimerase n=1 Tax=Desulfurobacterium atlanticum TaxID=240169 RepID=A0A238YP22_9BACT|nr:GDP-mannose 4,6-dehydratase [Desulfurobacterium atlanticum]SNR72752.1 Nucleoside-diphosphate-sugar epimerase [Desulfurobacterium atlanticum]